MSERPKQCSAQLYNDSRTTCYACTQREGHAGPHGNGNVSWQFEPTSEQRISNPAGTHER